MFKNDGIILIMWEPSAPYCCFCPCCTYKQNTKYTFMPYITYIHFHFFFIELLFSVFLSSIVHENYIMNKMNIYELFFTEYNFYINEHQV